MKHPGPGQVRSLPAGDGSRSAGHALRLALLLLGSILFLGAATAVSAEDAETETAPDFEDIVSPRTDDLPAP